MPGAWTAAASERAGRVDVLEVVRDEQLAVDQPDIGLDAGESVRQGILQRAAGAETVGAEPVAGGARLRRGTARRAATSARGIRDMTPTPSAPGEHRVTAPVPPGERTRTLGLQPQDASGFAGIAGSGLAVV